MATRTLTDTFIFMRNNAIQNRQFSGEKKMQTSDKEKLLGDMTSIELGSTSSENVYEWQALVKSINYEFSVVRQKMKDLLSLHDRHIGAATLDDNLDEDQEIEAQTRELTELFTMCHRQLGDLCSIRRGIKYVHGKQNDKLAENVISSLARTLQELSTTFRKAQSRYLNNLRTRDERVRGYLNITLDSELSADDANGLAEFDLMEPNANEFTQQLLVDNGAAVVQREQEITQIVRSIHELNEIFRDVSQLVVDQGTLVDRIDYNVEQSQIHVEKSLGQLTKAQRHQKKDLKLVVILVLASLVTVMGVLLLVTKISH